MTMNLSAFSTRQSRHTRHSVGRISSLAALVAVLSVAPAYAASFNISSSSSSAQTLSTGQTGTITSTGSLTVSGSTVAVSVTGNNASLTNLGTLRQSGTGRAIRDNTGVNGLTVTNGSSTNSAALMETADADVIQMNVAGGSVTLNNYGTMTSLNASKGGSQAVDFTAITSGTNVVNNFISGIMRAYEADAVRPGINGVVNNYGLIQAITTTGSSSDGVDAQNNSGVQVNNNGTIQGGRHGITGGQLSSASSYSIAVTNNVGGTVKGDNGSGINIDGFNALQTATVINNGSIIGNGVTGDGDGIDVDGLVNITNTGIIRSLNAVSSSGIAQSEGISVGGGNITNSGLIEGLVAAGNSNAVGRGISLLGNDITTGALAGTREAIYGNATIINQTGGVIRGGSDSGIAVDGPRSGFKVTINNNAGASIIGGGTTNAAIRTAFDDDSLDNAGLIDGSSSGKAIDLGGGNNTLTISGGSASVLGNIDGGAGGTNAMTMNLGNGNSFSYAGSILDFNSVELKSGHATFSGASSYVGNTIVSGGTLTLDGINRLNIASALTLSGGNLQLVNAGAANGQTFSSLSLAANATIDLGGSSLTFNGLGSVSVGTTLAIYNAANGSSYALRFLGDDTHNTAFLALMNQTTINGQAVAYNFDGAYTNVSAVPLPGTMALLLSGVGLLSGLARRRGGAMQA